MLVTQNLAALSESERAFVAVAYDRAIDALRRNCTRLGFSACSLDDNETYGVDVNYRSVWARDGAMTLIWTLELNDPEIRACQLRTLRTLFAHQTPLGLIPTSVSIDSGRPEFSGVGGIAGIDSVMWAVIALARYVYEFGDFDLIDEFAPKLELAMNWLRSQDVNDCGLLEIPEAGDWTDLFARSYHVLYDEVVWYRCVVCYGAILQRRGDPRASEFADLADLIKGRIIATFWPSTAGGPGGASPPFSATQYSLGEARYLVAQVTPFAFSWRCDVLGNLLAVINNLIDPKRAQMIFRFLWGVGINDPWPAKCLYPPVQAGDPEWRSYFTVNLLNLPDHYHNGGIWPFIGSLWVRFLHKIGETPLAHRELERLARLCAMGVSHEWEFNEWHHGETGRPMGKAFQAWSAAAFVQACHDLSIGATDMAHHE